MRPSSSPSSASPDCIRALSSASCARCSSVGAPRMEEEERRRSAWADSTSLRSRRARTSSSRISSTGAASCLSSAPRRKWSGSSRRAWRGITRQPPRRRSGAWWAGGCPPAPGVAPRGGEGGAPPAVAPPDDRPAPSGVLQWAHGGEEQHVADAGTVGEQHHQAVDTDAETPGGWHAGLDGPQEVLIQGLGLGRAQITLARLLLEAGALVD